MKRPASRVSILIVLIVGLLVFGGVAFAWNTATDIFSPAGTSTKPIPIEIQSGESPQAIAEDLQNKGLIRSSFAFLIWARIQGVDQKFQAGLYKGLAPHMTIQQIIQLLQDGQPDAIPYTIVEGHRIEQIANV